MPYFTCFGVLRMPYFTSFGVFRMPYFTYFTKVLSFREVHGSRYLLSSICWLAAQPRKAPVLLLGLENLKNSQIHRCF